MILYGNAHRVGDDITTRAIIAPEHGDDPATLAAFCLADVAPDIAEHVRDGDILLAGRGFGVGDAPEIAVLALQAAGFAAIICIDCDPVFADLAASYGLPVVTCPAAVAAIASNQQLRLDLARGILDDRTTRAHYRFPPCAPALLDTLRRHMLLAQMRHVVEEEGFDG